MPDDPDPIPAGATGTVLSVTTGPLAQVEIAWDGTARSLALIPGVDRFQVIGHVDDNPWKGGAVSWPLPTWT